VNAAAALTGAILSRLSADSALGAALGPSRVFDAVPYNHPFPFAVIGEMTSADWSTGGESGLEHSFVLHIWARAGGKALVNTAAQAIHSALHEAKLALEGHSLVNLRHRSTDVRRDGDGETFHGVMRFRAVTEPANPFLTEESPA
jgi:hypothetical protein